MADVVDKKTRSRMMSGIRSKNTKPEIALRREMHALGFRFRLHANGVPGRPDLLFPKFKAAVFVHGCFWHRHAGCRYATTPATRNEFWQSKFDGNVARDIATEEKLLKAGWRVGVVWECALRKPKQIERAAILLSDWLRTDSKDLIIGEFDVLP